jgi:hypothetical protein
LAALPTEELHNKVVGALKQDFSGDFWIGLAKAADGIGWEWVDGSFLIYENWASSQPLDGKHAYVSGDTSALWRSAEDSETRGAYAMQSTSPGLAEADLVLTTGEWASDSLVNRDGYMSARASALDNSSTYREYMIAGPALLDFYWKVSSEKDFDYFTFSINGGVRDSISGEVDWAYRSIELGPGSHRIRWEYSKDESAGIGADAAWLDEVVVYPAVADLESKLDQLSCKTTQLFTLVPEEFRLSRGHSFYRTKATFRLMSVYGCLRTVHFHSRAEPLLAR